MTDEFICEGLKEKVNPEDVGVEVADRVTLSSKSLMVSIDIVYFALPPGLVWFMSGVDDRKKSGSVETTRVTSVKSVLSEAPCPVSFPHTLSL